MIKKENMQTWTEAIEKGENKLRNACNQSKSQSRFDEGKSNESA